MINEVFIKYPEMKTLFKLIPSGEKVRKWDATSGEILPETAALHFTPIDELIFTEKIDGTSMGIRNRKDTLPVRRWMAKIRKKDFKT